MGKQVKGWVPPEEDMIVDATDPKTSWTPPATDEVVDVKKKDESVSPISSASSDPGVPSKKSGAKPISTAESVGDAIGSVSPLGRMVYDAGRRILSGFTDDIPKSIAQGLEVAKSSVSPKNIQEYIRNNKPYDFQRYVREKENIPWYKPFGDEGMDKYIEKHAEQFMIDTGRGDLAKRIKENEPKVVERRLKVEQYAQKQTEEAQQKMSGAVQSITDIKDINDVASYIGTLGGQAAYQIPLSVLTKGGSSLLQESATIYDQQLDNISREKGISREEVIKQGLDKPAEGQAFAVLAAGLDAVSAGNIINALKHGGGSVAKQWARTAIPEAITEPAQGVLEDVGAATGDRIAAAGAALLSTKRLDEIAGGLVGGSAGAISSVSNNENVSQNEKLQEQIDQKDAVSEQEATKGKVILQNDKKESNLIQGRTQEISGINTEAKGDSKAEVLNRRIEASYAWLQSIERGNLEESRDFEKEMLGESISSQELQGSILLDDLNRAGEALRTQSIDGGNSGQKAEENGTRASQEQGQPGQQSRELNVGDTAGTPKISSQEQRIHEDAGNEIQITIKSMVKEILRLRDVQQNDKASRIARDMQRMLSEASKEQKVKILNTINDTFKESAEQRPATEGFVPPATDDIIEQPRADQSTSEQPRESVPESVAMERQPIDSAGDAVVDQPVEEKTTATPAKTGSVALDQSEEQRVSGIKKALVSEEKIGATEIERRSTEDMLNRAKSLVDAGELNPKAVVDEIATGNPRALQPDEVAGLVYYKTQLDNRSDTLNADLVKAIESGDEQAQTSLRAQIGAVDQEIDAYETMAVKTAYEQSLAFRLRQMMMNNQYNLQTQINKYKAANNGNITTEVENKFRDLDTQLKAANAKIAKLEETQQANADTEQMQLLRQEAQRQRENRIKSASARKEKINSFFDSLKVKTDPGKLNSITQVVGESVWNGSVEVMRSAVLAGSDVATAIQAGIDYVKEHYRGTDFDEAGYRNTVLPGVSKLVPDEAGKPTMRNGKLHIPASTIRSFVEGGATDINDLTNKIHQEVVKVFPDASQREVRDAITQYGETRKLSQEDINVKIRGMKRMGKLISAVEDIQNKKRPLRSGLQRDKPGDEERRLQKQIKEGMKDIPVDETEQAQAWKNALDAVKSRLKNQITDLENQIKTGEKTPKKAGIKYDEEATALQTQRDALKKIIQDIEGPGKMSDEQKTRMAVAGVKKNIEELQRRIKDKDTSKKPSSSTTVTPELQALRDQQTELRKEYQQMEKDLGIADKKKLEAYKSALKKAISTYEQRIKTQDFARTDKKKVALDNEATKLKADRDAIKAQFDLEQEKARLKNRSMGEKVWDTAMEVWNIPKSLLATIDMSAPFRQGAILTASNPGAALNIKKANNALGFRAEGAFPEMFRQAFSQKKADEWLANIKQSPEYAEMRAAKLYLAEPTTKMTAKEEQFISNFAAKIPVLGPLVKGSERAYAGYLNKLRVDVFANGADRLREQGITPESNPEAYKALASFINNATGRGNLGGMEMAAPVLNGLFFSPRYVASRVNLINPVTYAKMPAPVRKMALKSMVTFIGFNALLLGLAAAAGADVEEDPRSSDFGKIKIGDTRYDVWAGFQQIIRLIAQIATGERKSTRSGKITKLDGTEFPFETRADVAMRFGRSKLSPSAGTVADILVGQTMDGEEVTVKEEVIKNVLPLYIQDMTEMIQKDGATGLLTTALPAFFGVGVQDYSGEYGLESTQIDDEEIKALNKKNNYSFSKPKISALTESMDHTIDDTTFDKYKQLREEAIKKLFDRYKFRLEEIEDKDIYDKMMDDIVREAQRHAKYKIAKENRWDASGFAPGDPFRLHKYKKNEDGKLVRR